MKKLIVLLIFIVGGKAFAQNDFDAKSPTTDGYDGYCYPIQTGKSIKVPIKVKCNMTKKYQPYKVSINIPSSFNSDANWVTIDNNSQSVDSSKTITFNLTITPPKTPNFTIDGQYSFTLYFDIYNKDNTHLDPSITQPSFKVIVDNSAPNKPTPSVQTKKSNYISIEGFGTSDPNNLSSTYSLANDTAGINGIQNLTFLLKRVSDNKVIDNTTDNVKDVSSFYVFKQNTTPITANTSYTAYVAAVDLAGNASTSNGILITTPPAPPKTFTISSRDYCSITLSWSTSDGASGYYVYDASFKQISSTMVTGTSYTISGLKAGTTYNYYLAAYSNAGGKSELSTSFSASTLDLPTPTISSSLSMCSSDKTMTVSPVLGASSYSWTVATPLSINGNQTYTTTSNSVKLHASSLSGTSMITVAANLACGFPSKSTSKSIRLGLPSINSSVPISYYNGSTYNNVCNSQSFSTSFNVQNEDNVTWTRIAANPEITEWYQSGDNVNFYFFYVNQTAVFKMDVSNGCGTISHNFGFKSIDCNGGGGDCNVAYTASPNPASNKTKIIVNIPAPCSSTLQETTFDGNITVFDNQGLMKKRIDYNRYEDAEFDVSDLKNGVYYLEIFDGTIKTTKTIIIKH